MFNLRDRVKHQETGDIGTVVGFGRRIVNNKCLRTIKVKIISPTLSEKRIVEGIDYKWLPCPKEDNKLPARDSLAHHSIKKPVKKYNLAEST